VDVVNRLAAMDLANYAISSLMNLIPVPLPHLSSLLLTRLHSVPLKPHPILTLRAKLSGAMYCNQSYLWVYLCVCVWVCYHDNSKLRASIFTKVGL